MLDTTNVRSEIAEARKTRDAYAAQRSALDTTIAKLEAYIEAAEALVQHLPVMQQPLDLGEQPVGKEPSLRDIVRKIMRQNTGVPMMEVEVYDIAVNEGAEPRATREKGAEAVKFALYDLRKKDNSYARASDGTWTYIPF